MTQAEQDKYRFSAERYSLRGANASRPGEYVPQLPGMYPFPLEENMPQNSSSSSSLSSRKRSSKSLSVSTKRRSTDVPDKPSSYLPF